ncbi:MAG TPA: hypothetical protein VLE47_04620 [Candidatus Saccharimonadales bacterium]|nr:hypothetical protein [Candidatus Saccharimonadales bacterium]
MTLPEQVKNQKGQVLVIFLLVLVIGLALVLSIASRTVIDIRQTTTSDESNRAYYAAESGVEDGLKKITSGYLPAQGAPQAININLSTLNNSQATGTLAVYPDSGNKGKIVDFGTVQKDDVVQVILMCDFNNPATAGASSPPCPAGTTSILPNFALSFYFGTSPTVDAASPALEISFVTYSGGAGGTFGIKKMTIDPFAARATTNHFCNSAVGATTPQPEVSTEEQPTSYYQKTTFLLTNPPCNGVNESLSGTLLVMARIKVLYHSTPIGVMSLTKDLPQQGFKITSIGSTPSGVTRKLVNKSFYPALPALFDYVLYNGSGSQDLCKGSCP